jgi:DNA-binding HxlR family transcriptional regulator
MKFKMVEIKLSEETREEIKKLREEIAELKEQLENVTEKEEKRRHGIYIDVGNNVRNYVEDVMESVTEGIHGELERCIFIGPRGVRIIRKGQPIEEEKETEVDFSKVSEVMSALGQEYRLRVLEELVSGGKYINELQEKLSEITASTLSSHLKVLEEAGLVVQEKVRGRYLITMPGRIAYNMALRITRFLERGNQE